MLVDINYNISAVIFIAIILIRSCLWIQVQLTGIRTASGFFLTRKEMNLDKYDWNQGCEPYCSWPKRLDVPSLGSGSFPQNLS